MLLNENIRVEFDDSNESMGKKIRQSNIMKNPYTLIIGDNERDNDLVSYRKYGNDENYNVSLNEFINLIKEEVNRR
jgi:threonyl-tRNA synthetase